MHSKPYLRTLMATAGLLAGMAACGAIPAAPEGSARLPGSATAPAATPTPEPIVFSSNVEDGATDVAVDTLVTVSSDAGKLSKVSLSYRGTDTAGEPTTAKVPGTLSKDGSSWTASERLDPGARYSLVMRGVNASDSATTTEKSAFTTEDLSLEEQTYPTLFPQRGTTVGVGMPVVLTFDVPVADREAVEKHLEVTSSPRQKGSWHWYSDTEVHYRPKNYWEAGTTVKVEANLNGVNAGNGVYGQHSVDTSFTIGRSVVTKIDLARKQARVYVNGDLGRTIPVSGGKPGFISRSGTKLIMAKLPETRMASETIGIAEDSSEGYDLQVKYAMRVTSSGEFLHAAPWNAGKFGSVNASHGCIGMSTADAQWLFNTVNIGDPVVTTGTGRPLEAGNGWTDWDVSFAEYQEGSALS
jgi:lipoprotein-anchoring transpeptidase ErfK/SrfK